MSLPFNHLPYIALTVLSLRTFRIRHLNSSFEFYAPQHCTYLDSSIMAVPEFLKGFLKYCHFCLCLLYLFWVNIGERCFNTCRLSQKITKLCTYLRGLSIYCLNALLTFLTVKVQNTYKTPVTNNQSPYFGLIDKIIYQSH